MRLRKKDTHIHTHALNTAIFYSYLRFFISIFFNCNIIFINILFRILREI